MRIFLCLIFLAFVSIPKWSHCQKDSAMVFHISDAKTGLGVPFANIALVDKRGKTFAGVSTDFDGLGVVTDMPSVFFAIKITSLGYLPATSEMNDPENGLLTFNVSLQPDSNVIFVSTRCYFGPPLINDFGASTTYFNRQEIQRVARP